VQKFFYRSFIMIFNIGLLAVFFALVTGIGIWGVKHSKTVGDFFLGGRKAGPWVSAFAYGTSYFSAVMVIGFAGTQGWLFGMNALWIAAGNALIGSLLAWLILAKRTRRQTQNLGAMTMPEYLQRRYDAKRLKPLAACVIFLFLLPYSASIFKGLGNLFQSVFHIPFDIALLLMIAFTGVYLILGGYTAIVMVDFIQGILMIAGALAMFFCIVREGGGLFASVAAANTGFATNITQKPGALTIISLVLMTSFGTWGLPQMTQKFYAIKNEQVIPRAAIVCTVFAGVVGFASYFVGTLSHVFFDATSVPSLASGTVDYDLIVPTLLVRYLPDVLMALILLFVLSASMSTLSSLVLISASAIAIDLFPYKDDANSHAHRSTVTMRVLSLVFIIASYIITRFQFSIIVTLMSVSWGAVSGAFAAPYIWGLYSRRVTKAGAYSGMATGVATEIVLFASGVPGPLAACIAIALPFAVVPIVSAFSRPPHDAVLSQAFAPPLAIFP
jgi:SSS family solute:Na+ symporter